MKLLHFIVLFGLTLSFPSQALAEKQFYVQVEGQSIHLLNMPHPSMALPADQAQKGWILHVAAEYALVDGTTFYEIDELDRNGTGFIKVSQAYPDLPAQAVFIMAEDVKIIPDPTDDPSANIISVSTARDFLQALGSNRTIILQPGHYNLSEYDPINQDKDLLATGFYENLAENGIFWQKNFDGHELKLQGLSNLTIMAEEPGSVTLIVDPRYVFVLAFTDCQSISLKNFIAGHSEGGYCEGGVFSFKNSKNIDISDCRLFGSGTVGLEIYDTKSLTMAASTIMECTYGIMRIVNSSEIIFNNCLFHDNKEFFGVSAGSSSVFFNSCAFTNNIGPMFSGSGSIVVKNTSFTGNDDQEIQTSPHVVFENCIFQ